ncbi:unnamed protein product [Soboliphyme baturini]|uniref:PABS domain-containing protein n=1 Tax=Soboliphyme baturini TaxID=241478 RepID=A0A183IPT8_9BILA|nr:unnamed protein product [Soboliphyme baturini]
MNALKSGWFSELPISDPATGEHAALSWPGQAFSLEVEKVLCCEKSLQDILVFESKTYGNVFVLDGVIQFTERDEFSYQEMMAHIPMFLHENPKNVLVIGGGDGGVIREVLKHSSVESVTHCEIDQKVIEVCKKYFPSMSSGFSDPRVDVHIEDGLKFLEKNRMKYDIIITDSTDPSGAAQSLYQKSYYQLLSSSLSERGIVLSQAESIWLHLDFIAEMCSYCRTVFPVVSYCFVSVPTYPSGTIGFLVCCKDKVNFVTCVPQKPKRILTDAAAERMNLRFYTSAIHEAAFALPRFADKNDLKAR